MKTDLADVTANVAREPSSVFDGIPIIPVLTITHLFGKFGTNLTAPVLNTLTMVGVGDSPNDLAKAFLTFVSQGAVPYTQEELSKVSQVICDIHQRHYKTP
jgi:hypothetical protein